MNERGKIIEILTAFGCQHPHLALDWLMSNPDVTVGALIEYQGFETLVGHVLGGEPEVKTSQRYGVECVWRFPEFEVEVERMLDHAD